MNGGDKMNREDFPMLKKDYIYFDNGATTFKPKSVIDEISNYYLNLSVNAHRGDYDLSRMVDELYEETRDLVKDFRKSCSVFDDELHAYYDNVAERGADGDDLDYLIGLMNELLSLQTVKSKDKVRTGNLVLNSIKEKFYARKAHIDTYLAKEEEEKLRLNETIENEFILGFRKIHGLDINKLNTKYKKLDKKNNKQ